MLQEDNSENMSAKYNDASSKPGTADLATKRIRERYRSPDLNARYLSTNGQRSHSDLSAGGRPKSCLAGRDLKPPHHPKYASTTTISDPYKYTPNDTGDAKRIKETCTPPVRSRKKLSSFGHIGPSEDFENPPKYCIISSAGSTKSNNDANVSTSKHRKEIFNQRASKSFVITADTATLLVQSKSAPIFRSVSDVGARSKTKSAIERVHYANRGSSASFATFNNVSRSNSSSNIKELVKSNSAHARTSGLHGREANYAQSEFKPEHNFSVPNSLSLDYNIHSTLNDNSSGSDYQLQKIASNANFPSENASSVSCAFVALQRTPSDDSFLFPQYNNVKVGDYSQCFLMSNSSGLPFIHPSTFTSSSHGPLASNKLNNKQHGTKKFKSKTDNSIGPGKTLTPSKHGYHPRSQSPTFKRLIAVAERLEETFVLEGPLLSPTVSKSREELDSDESSDSLRRLRYYRDYLTGFDQGDYTSDENTARRNPVRKTSIKETVEVLEVPEKRRVSLKEQTKCVDVISPKNSKELSPKRHAAPIGMASEKADGQISYENSGIVLDQEPANGDFNMEPPKEPELRVMNGQPTQLHFFLPQLADNMSEASGGTLTGRSFYQEQRIELLDRNELLQENKVISSSHFSRSRHKNGAISSHYGKGSGINSENFGKSTVAIGKQQKYFTQGVGMANGYGDKDSGQRDTRNRSLSPGREESLRARRYASPLRNKNCTLDKPTRRKQSQTNYKLVPYEYTYLESQLPSEKLKKQIDNFPTLVSMEFSGTTTPCQSR